MITTAPLSVTADTTPNPGTPKLRASCNSCGEAKVKCDRKQPVCRRCTSLGLICVYGLSRQFGKPPRKRPAIDVVSSARCKRPVVYNDKNRDQYTETPAALPPQVDGFGHMQLAASTTIGLPSTSEVTSTTCMGSKNTFESSFINSDYFDEWSQMDDAFSLDLGFQSMEKSPANANSFSVATLPSANSSRIDACSQSHSCPRESYEIFRDLICPSANLHAPESNSDLVAAQLDEVLRCTRTAVNRLTRVLRCSCARSGHRIMVHASIISRILLWYQQAAGWIRSDAWPSRSLELADSPTSGRTSPAPKPSDDATTADYTQVAPTLAQSTGFVVEHVPVSLGTFSIEDHNMQALVRDQLVLSELKKTADLIDLFTSSDCCESSANSIAAPLGAWLRDEHSRTARVLTRRLDALNECLN